MKYLLVVGLTFSMLNVPVFGVNQDHGEADPPVAPVEENAREIKRPFWKFWAKNEVVENRAHVDVAEFRKLQQEDIDLLLDFLEEKREEVKEIETKLETRKHNRIYAYGLALVSVGAGLFILKQTMHIDEVPTTMGDATKVVSDRLKAMRRGILSGTGLLGAGSTFLGYRGTTALTLRRGLKEAHKEIDRLELVLLKRKEILDAEQAKKEAAQEKE